MNQREVSKQGANKRGTLRGFCEEVGVFSQYFRSIRKLSGSRFHTSAGRLRHTVG